MTAPVSAAALRGFVGEIFHAAGCSREEGARVARYLVEANLTGHDSHGVIRVPRYVHWMETGAVRPDRSARKVVDHGSFAVFDGERGFGQTIGEQVIAQGIEMARTSAVAVVGIRNVGHLGRIGDWAEMAAGAGLVSVHFVNTTGLGLLVAPFGGTERRMSTNPFAIGVPLPDTAPLVLDFATSIVAEGKVLVALNDGKALPDGALVDRDGTRSTDPRVIYGPVGSTQPLDQRSGTGAIRAMGEHKGSGIGFMCEILAGALTGGGCSRPGTDVLRNNMLSILIDAARLDVATVWPEAQSYIDFFRSARPAPPHDRVRVPGEIEQEMRARRASEGVPITAAVWRSLVGTARTVGLDDACAEAALGDARAFSA